MSLLQWEAPWIHVTNDFTTAGLFELLEKDKEGRIRTVILPDFNLPLSHRASVTNLTIANMLSLMTEGVVRIDDGRNQKEIKHPPINFITGVTPDMYLINFRRWSSLGMLRRFLLINYDYSFETRLEGRKIIRMEKATSAFLGKINLQPKQVLTTIPIRSEIDIKIEQIAVQLATHLGVKLIRDYKTHTIKWNALNPALEFSPIVVMRTMARAHAITRDSLKVSEQDVDFLIDLLKFTNPQSPEKV